MKENEIITVALVALFVMLLSPSQLYVLLYVIALYLIVIVIYETFLWCKNASSDQLVGIIFSIAISYIIFTQVNYIAGLVIALLSIYAYKDKEEAK